MNVLLLMVMVQRLCGGGGDAAMGWDGGGDVFWELHLDGGRVSGLLDEQHRMARRTQ